MTSFDNEPPGQHSTNIAGIIFGDLTHPQIAAVPLAHREPTSGFAREATAHFFLVDSANGTILALDEISGLNYEAHVVNNSYQWNLATACAGDNLVSRMANQAYLNGSAFFSGAGNSGGSSGNCQVRAPGDAIGSFTVGAHMHANGTNLDVRQAGIWDDGQESSAWGGNGTQGQNRSVVSMTAAGRRTYRISEDGSYEEGQSGGKTSYATAVVSATALDVMDHQMRDGSTWIGAPGALYAALLAMGDRQGVGGKHNSVPDHRWGVGRLRARMLAGGSMDGPWYWYHGATCIGDGETWDLDLSGANMPDDVESVKVAAYWYDYRHDGSDGNAPSGEVANVNVSLRGVSSLYAFDSDAHDNKAFVYHSNWPVDHVVVRLYGNDVEDHHDPACSGAAPNDQIKAYFLVFAEDDDREAPTYNAMTGEGIYPESL